MPGGEEAANLMLLCVCVCVCLCVFAERLIVALFWAPWSQPCSQMLDAAEELSKEYDNVKFLKVRPSLFIDL